MIGMVRRKDAGRNLEAYVSPGFVPTHIDLVADELDLFVELLLRKSGQEVAHPVRFQPKHGVELRDRHSLIDGRQVRAGAAIDVGATEPLHRHQEIVRMMLRSIEQQMFEQVRQPRLARRIVARSSLINHLDRNDRQLVVLANEDRQSIVQGELRERQNRLELRRFRGRLRPSRRRHERRAVTNSRGDAPPVIVLMRNIPLLPLCRRRQSVQMLLDPIPFVFNPVCSSAPELR